MSKSSLLYVPAVEELGEVPAVEELDFDATMLVVMEAELEMADGFSDFDQIGNDVDDVSSSVERLSGIAVAIEKYGICAPMMEAADPQAELVEAGIVCAYEELGDAPVKDEKAEATLENVMDTIMNSCGAASDKIAFTSTMKVLERDGDKNAGDKKGDNKVVAGAKKAGEAVAGAAKDVRDKIDEKTKGLRESASEKYHKVRHGVETGAKAEVTKNQAKLADFAAKVGEKHEKTGELINKVAFSKNAVGIGMATVAAVFIAAAAVIMYKLTKAFMNWLTSYKSALEKAKAALGEGSIDESKFGGMKISGYSEANFKRAVKASTYIAGVVNSGKLAELASQMEGAMTGGSVKVQAIHGISSKAGAYLKGIANNPDVKACCGFVVNAGENGFEVSSKSPEIKTESGTASAMGWKGAHVRQAVSEALSLAGVTEGTVSHVDAAAKMCDKIAKQLRADKHAEMTGEEKEAYKQAIKNLREIVAANKTIFQLNATAVRSICTTAISAYKCAMKCKA